LGSKFQEDIDIAKKAISININNVKYLKKSISSKIFNNKELNEKLLTHNLDYFNKINNKFRDNEEFFTHYIKQKPSLIEYASKRLKNNKDFVSLALTAYNLLENIPDTFKSDQEMMQKHISSCPHSIYEISKFQNVKPLIMNILHDKHYIYEYLNNERKMDDDYIYAVLNHNTFF